MFQTRESIRYDIGLPLSPDHPNADVTVGDRAGGNDDVNRLRMAVTDSNPYKSTINPEQRHGTAVRRFRATILVLNAVILVGIGLDLRDQAISSAGNGPWIHPVAAVVFLAFAAFVGWLVFVEFFGNRRSMRWVPLTLVPLLLLSIFAALGLLANRSTYLTSSWIRDHPSVVAGWIACPIIWYYFSMSSLRWWRLRKSRSVVE